MNLLRRELADAREAFRVLTSREFWEAFNDYFFGEGMQGRIDDWVSRVRENTGQPADEAVEARRHARAAQTATSSPPEVGSE